MLPMLERRPLVGRFLLATDTLKIPGLSDLRRHELKRERGDLRLALGWPVEVVRRIDAAR